ncbi:hypothetical protein QOT17_022399 [Balamuthia mandrillaris]
MEGKEDLFVRLPWELAHKIWTEFLGPRNVPALALVCHRWRALCYDQDVWRRWYFQRFGKPLKGSMDFRELFRSRCNRDSQAQSFHVGLLGDGACLTTQLCQLLVFGSAKVAFETSAPRNTFVARATGFGGRRINLFLHITRGGDREHIPQHLNVWLLCCGAKNVGPSYQRLLDHWSWLVSSVSLSTIPTKKKANKLKDITILSVGVSDKEEGGDQEALHSLFGPLVCDLLTGKGAQELLQIIADACVSAWSAWHLAKEDKGFFRSIFSRKKAKEGFKQSILQSFLATKPIYNITLKDETKLSLDFIADSWRYIFEMTHSSSEYCHHFTTLMKPFTPNESSIPEELKEHTVEYLIQLSDFIQKITSTFGLMNTIDSLLTWGNLSCWGKDLPTTRLLFEILYFLIRFDLSTASTQMTNSLAAAVSINAADLLDEYDNPTIASQILHVATPLLSRPLPFFSCFLRDVTPSSPSPSAVAEYELAQLRLKRSALMGSVANLCLALLEETDSSEISFYCHVMTAAILYHSVCSSKTFNVHKSPIYIEECLQALQRFKQHRLLDVLLHNINATQWTCHSSAPVKQLLRNHRATTATNKAKGRD